MSDMVAGAVAIIGGIVWFARLEFRQNQFDKDYQDAKVTLAKEFDSLHTKHLAQDVRISNIESEILKELKSLSVSIARLEGQLNYLSHKEGEHQ